MSEYTDSNPEQPQTESSEQSTKEQMQQEAAEVRSILAKIKGSEDYREQIARDYQWQEILQDYHGKSQITALGASDIYIPSLNLIFAYVESEQPSICFRDPHIKINPKNASSINSAKILEKSINYIWRSKRIKRENKKNVKDTLLVSHSWFKTGYRGTFGTIEEANGNTYEFIKHEEFFGYRIPWDQMVFDLEATDVPFDCSWIAQKVFVPFEKAKKLYPNKNLEPTVYNKVSADSTKFRHTTKEEHGEPMVCFYEFWNKETMEVCVVSPGCDSYVESPKQWPYQIKGFPFSFLQFNDSPSQPYGIPDVYTFRSQVIELIKVRAQQLDHLKRFNRQFQVDESVSEDDINKFTQGMTGAMTKGDLSKGDLIKPIIFPSVPADTYAVGTEIKEDLINISGQSPQERGATQKTSTRTFRELAQIRRGAENRRSQKIDRVEDFIEDIAGNLVAILQQYADVPFYVKVTGKEYQEIAEALKLRPSAASNDQSITSPQGFTFTKEDIIGDFEIECVAGSTVPLDREQTVETTIRLLEMLPQLGITKGPLPQTLGKILGENLDMPEIQMAIDAQAQFDMEQAEAASKQAEEVKQFEVGKQTAKTQIEAEKVGVKQTKNLIDLTKVLRENDKKIDGE